MKRLLYLVAIIIITVLSKMALCDISVPLIAGQWHEIGTVNVSNDINNLYINYILDGPCGFGELDETHLHVSTIPETIPQNKKGNPQIGHFGWSEGMSFTIPFSDIGPDPTPEIGDTVYIAAHGVTKDMNDLALSLPTEPFKLKVINYSQSGRPYIDINIFDDSTLNGPHVAWCLDLYKDINVKEYHAYVVDFIGINEINWLLNNYIPYMGQTSAQGDPYVPGDVQAAIWLLFNGMPDYERPDPNGNPDTNPWSQWAWGLGCWGDWTDHDGLNDDGVNAGNQYKNYDEDEYNDDKARAMELAVDAVLYGKDFKPGCCEVTGLVIQPYLTDNPKTPEIEEDEYHQPLIIEIPVACGGETAWGDGIDGIPFAPMKNGKRSGSWAKYFKYKIEPVLGGP